MSETVNALWIGGELSPLEVLTMRSFIANGFTFQLWIYDPSITNVPDHVIIKDANDIIPSANIFTYRLVNKFGHGKNSYAGFSDIFRYKLLYDKGGVWTDMDITCLKPFEIPSSYFFRYHHKSGAVGNFMKCPANSELMLWCYEQAAKKINENNTDWMLPVKILNEGIKKFQLQQYIAKLSNNDSFPEVAKMLVASPTIPVDWKIIHWMNEELSRLQVSKQISLPGSLLDQLFDQYNIPHHIYTGFDVLKNRILLSRYFYLLKNINSTMSWYLSPH